MYGCNECTYANHLLQAFTDNVDPVDVVLLIDKPSENDFTKILDGNPLRELMNGMDVTWKVICASACIPMQGSKIKRINDYRETPCWVHMLDAIKQAQPKVVISFGESLANSLLGHKVDHTPVEYNFHGYTCTLLTTNHQTSCDYRIAFSEPVARKIADDIVDACRVIFDEREKINKQYHTVVLDAQQFHDKVQEIIADSSIEYVGYDTESNTLDPLYKGAKITSFSFATDHHTGYNVYLWSTERYISDEERDQITADLKILLEGKKIIVHNAKHEYRLAKVIQKIRPNIVHDTMLLAYILFNDIPFIHYGLKYLSGRYASMPNWETELYKWSKMFVEMNKKKDKLCTNDFLVTCAQRYNLNPELSTLRRCADIILDPKYPIKHEWSDSNDVFYWLVPEGILNQYAGYDAIAPLILYSKLRPMLEADPTFIPIYTELVKGAETYGDIELRGIQVADYEQWKKRYEGHINSKIEEIRKFPEIIAWEQENDKEWAISKTAANADIIYNRLGCPEQGKTAKGALSCSKDSILALFSIYESKEERTPEEEHAYQFLCLYWDIKKFMKVYSTYFIGLEKFMSTEGSFDGVRMEKVATNGQLRIHPSYNIHGIATGRMSSSNPSLHTIPDRSDIKAMLRSAWDGYGGLILQSDYGQLELRVVAACAERFYGDHGMAQAFRDGVDIHRFNASNFFGKSMEEITGIERTKAKTISFGIAYGMGIPAMAEKMHLTEEEATKRYHNFLDNCPGIRAFMEDMHKFVREHGYIRTMTGRIRWLPYGMLPDTYKNRSMIAAAQRKAGNAPVQGSGSDRMLLALNAFEEARKRSNLRTQVIGTIHDSDQLDVYPGELITAADLLTYCMKDLKDETLFHWLNDVPMGVDLELGDSFYHSSEFKILEHDGKGGGIVELSGQDRINDPVLKALNIGYEVELDKKKEWTDNVTNNLRWGAESFSYVGEWPSSEWQIKLTKRDPELVRRFLIANHLMEV